MDAKPHLKVDKFVKEDGNVVEYVLTIRSKLRFDSRWEQVPPDQYIAAMLENEIRAFVNSSEAGAEVGQCIRAKVDRQAEAPDFLQGLINELESEPMVDKCADQAVDATRYALITRG